MRAIRMIQPRHPLRAYKVPVVNPGERDVLVRIRAAGICHSDAHYRAGRVPVHPLPLTLGHEIAGTVEEVGTQVTDVAVGDRVCIHYLLSCGDCHYCRTGHEQFCLTGAMLGHHTDGGYAEFITVPARNVVSLPDEIAFEQGAVLMCASATALHALRKSRLRPGETLAVFGVGGVGMSAVQLARAFGATRVFAVDLDEGKLMMASGRGAVPVGAGPGDPVAEIRRLTDGRGVDVALEMVGLPLTMRQAVQSLAVLGRAIIVGLTDQLVAIDTYREVLSKEAEIIGSNDHLLHDLPALIEFARRGLLDLTQVVTRTVPLDARSVNGALDDLERFGPDVRSVIVP